MFSETFTPHLSNIARDKFFFFFVFFFSPIYIDIIFEPAHDKTYKWHVRPAKTQISLGIWPV